MLESKLREMREGNETKLAEIQKTVNEQLHAAVEKQMNESFNRVIDQFTAVQKAMGDVQAVTAQIGDIKRLFSNVKTRGGWGETQVRAMLDDILPPGEYLTNCKVRPDSNDVVEFAVRMPMKGEDRPLLPIDAKFPVEDYERLLAASDAGDAEAERSASRMLERRMRDEAKKIASKYINPPVTVEFAVLYLPTDALYAEVARIPGLIDDIGRDCRVLVMGPSLFPALLRTIHLGFVTLALEQKADQIRDLLGATRTEMLKMDDVLERLASRPARSATRSKRRAAARARWVASCVASRRSRPTAASSCWSWRVRLWRKIERLRPHTVLAAIRPSRSNTGYTPPPSIMESSCSGTGSTFSVWSLRVLRTLQVSMSSSAVSPSSNAAATPGHSHASNP